MRVDRQYGGVGGGLRRTRGAAGLRADSQGGSRARQALAERDAWRARDRDNRKLRHLLKGVRELGEPDPIRIRLVNSVNPDRIAGQKTAAFEICDQLGDAPTHHFLPVGNAGNITAYWAGYKEYKSVGLSTRLPKMMGYQAAESAPIVVGHPIDDPHTVATAIKIGNPASWKGATNARDESGGVIDMITDSEILVAYRLIAAGGVFAEPASAASVAGLLKYSAAGGLKPGTVAG